MEAKIIFMASDLLQRPEYLTIKHDFSSGNPCRTRSHVQPPARDSHLVMESDTGSSWRPAARLRKRADANAAIDNCAGGVGEITFEDC
jgi:hypothetical protein